MSKMMNDLHRINESRKIQKSEIVVEDAPESSEQKHVLREPKGIFFIGFLIVVLIALSALSMSVSMKTFSQLEKNEVGAVALLETANKQGNEIQKLKTLISVKNSEELARIDELQNEIAELKKALKDREQEFSDMIVAYSSLKDSVEDSVEDLKMSDSLMQRKFITLNDKVQKFIDVSPYF